MAPPQTDIPPAANVLGTIGTVCWIVQTIPQIWHNYRRKSTEGLPGLMLMLWAVCGVPFGVYAIVQNFNFALKLQPQCFAALTLVAWGQTLYYHNHWRVWTAALTTVSVAAAFAVTEAILIITLRGPYQRGIEWPMMMMAIIASVLLALGLIPPYFELAKRNGRVVGINFIFLTVDWSGAFFSLMALVAQNTFDVLGGGLYLVCISLETGIFISQGIWLWRVRHVRREAKKAGMSYDEYVAHHHLKKLARSESSNIIADLEACHTEKRETIAPPEQCMTRPSKAAVDVNVAGMDTSNSGVKQAHTLAEKD